MRKDAQLYDSSYKVTVCLLALHKQGHHEAVYSSLNYVSSNSIYIMGMFGNFHWAQWILLFNEFHHPKVESRKLFSIEG